MQKERTIEQWSFGRHGCVESMLGKSAAGGWSMECYRQNQLRGEDCKV